MRPSNTAIRTMALSVTATLAATLVALASGIGWPEALGKNQGLTVQNRVVPGVARGPLPNFHQVHPYLYRGGQPDSSGIAKLKAMGVKTVIDLRAETAATRKEKDQVAKLGMRYIILPMSDKAPTQKQVDIFIQSVKEGQAKQEPVFVHCAHGSDRTGCMVGIWRVSEDGFSYDQAYKEMRQYYFGQQYTQLSAAVKKRAAK